MTLVPTPGQTVGPFFGFALPYKGSSELVPVGHPDAVRLHGRVLDGAGQPVPDALVELWQPDPTGAVSRLAGSLVRDAGFTGFGRAETDRAGQYEFATMAPGSMGEGAARYFALAVFARGLLDRLHTRAYLPGQDAERAGDRLLGSIAPDRRDTLVARAGDDGFEFDIRLQGEDETVFLAYPQD
jgi:protocatechuate 3,4-dioxygenase alpha subunit